MTVRAVVWVALGAAFGAPLRFVIDRAVQGRHRGRFPWGTFTVNIVGSFLLGTLTGPAEPSRWRSTRRSVSDCAGH
jgi:CrcB protein